MKHLSKRLLLVNTFGTFGYLSSLLLWAWTGIIYLPVFLANETIERVLIPHPPEEVIAQAPTGETSPAMIIVAVVITVIIMVVTAVILLRAPITIAKTGQAVTTKAASSVVPIITHGKPLPPAKKKRLTAELIKGMKLLLIITPMVLGCFGLFVELPLPFDLVLFLSCLLAATAIMWFSLQYIAARYLDVKIDRLV